jgi:hypothetical protein
LLRPASASQAWIAGLLGDLELHRSARFLLNDRRAVADASADTDIVNL